MKIIIITILVLDFLFFMRNNYTFSCGNKSRELISRYTDYLLHSKQYEIGENYYDKMEISYWKHLFSIWLWGKYSRIKPEYKDLLKPYMNK